MGVFNRVSIKCIDVFPLIFLKSIIVNSSSTVDF